MSSSTHAGLDVTADWTGGASVPIGKPIDNTSCYILDTQLQLLPLGLPGELMVSGVQARRGPPFCLSSASAPPLWPQAAASPLTMLLFRGAQVSRGYLKRPELTAEKFIPNPYVAGRPLHSRLYRTGNLVMGCPAWHVPNAKLLTTLGPVDTTLGVHPGRRPGSLAA